MFDTLRREQPNFTDKVQAVPGDMLEEGLGIRDRDRETLEAQVQVVFHSAATIRFDESLR